MNKPIKFLVAALLVASAAHAANQNDTNRTFASVYRTRDRHMQASLAHALVGTQSEDRANGTLQVTPFYGQTTNGATLGQAIGVNGKNAFDLGSAPTPGDALTWHFINGTAMSANPSIVGASISLNPQQRAYGTHINYLQHLDGIAPGLYFSIHAPILHVDANTRFSITNDSTGTIEQFFRGNYTNTTSGSTQTALKYGKFSQKSPGKTGVGDVEAMVGWNFMNEEQSHAGINAGLIIPTSAQANAENTFEPVLGYHAWGLGAGFNADVALWEGHNASLKLFVEADYRYLFENSQKRIAGINGTKDWSHLRLVGTLGQPLSGNNVLQPFANVGALDWKVKPGSQVDALAGFSYNNSGITVDLGYNFFFKEAEVVSLKNKDAYADGTYAFVPQNYDTTQTLYDPALGGTGMAAERVINKADLVNPGLPSLMNHKIYAGLSYTISQLDYPVLLGAGASYQFGDKQNTTAEGFDVWAKLGVSF